MKKFSLLLIVLSSLINCKAQIIFSDSLRASVLTVSPGVGAYERFGHAGFRIQDLRNDQDIVFHYGVYNYNEPNFIIHFVQGLCNYKMGACYTSDFIRQHQTRHLQLTEQELWLDSAQVKSLTNALLVNFEPQNRNYRYNFFFDNCSTRPFQMISKYCLSQTNGSVTTVAYDTAWVEAKTLRDMLQEKTLHGNWLDFGISLAIAARADKPATFCEQMFLPDYMAVAIDHASFDGHALVKSKNVLTPYGQDIIDEINNPGPWLLSPMAVTSLIFLLASIFLIFWIKTQNISACSKIFDSTLLLATGITGCILWFLNFFSEHPAVDNNANCLLFLPTNLLIIPIIWIKKAEKVRRIYFFIIFAAAIIYIIVRALLGQYCHPAMIPLVAAIIIFSLKYLKSAVRKV